MLDIAIIGDLVLDEPDADYWLSGIAPALREADLAVAHLEVPHTHSKAEEGGDIPAPGAPPENLAAVARAGISMVSLAGNHIADCGGQGIMDTVAELDRQRIFHAGAGIDVAAARKPALASISSRTVALLSYNCVGPETGWAGLGKPGCAYLPLVTADGSPVNPRADIRSVPPEAVEILELDVARARDHADIVLVAMHKGIVHTPAKLAAYERPVAQAAIEAGADAVISHHAHIVRGIEFHCGKPIFHGLGNGCVVTSALAPDQDHPERKEWARKRQEMFGFTPDPAFRLAPFHPEAVNAFIGRLCVQDGGEVGAGIVPVTVEAPGRPVLAKGETAARVRDYVVAITEAAGLPPIHIAANGSVGKAALTR